MARGVRERVADVRRLVEAADRVHRDRARIAPAIARSTGLSPEGVELGFGSLERSATDDEIQMLVDRAGDAPQVHVVLSANVFVAPLRALAVARAASERVTVRPSPRDPVLAEALVREAADGAIRIAWDREVSAVDRGEVHVYGRDETIAAIRAAARPGVAVRAHGSGLGVVVLTEGADPLAAAELVAADVVPFDQRGCMSPRVALVLGGVRRAEQFAAALDAGLARWGERVPPGSALDDESAEQVRWRDTLRFSGELRCGPAHAVGLGAPDAPIVVPPAGRCVLVRAASGWTDVLSALSPIARYVVVVGSDDPAQAVAVAPGARGALVGRMQHPPLDGPVDLRGPA